MYNKYQVMLAEDPEQLLAMVITADARSVNLTFAAEYVGAFADPRVEPALLALLGHSSSVVREGALMGLWYPEPPSQAVLLATHMLAAWDPSPGVRECAAGYLDEP